MRGAKFLCALSLWALGEAGPARADSFRRLSRELKPQRVAATRRRGQETFRVAGRRAAAWDQSLASRLADYYLSDKAFQSIRIVCVCPTRRGRSAWLEAALRAGTIAAALERRGAPAQRIAVFVRNDPRAPDGGELSITFSRRRPYYKRIGDNLVEGVKDVVTSPAELPRDVVATGKREGVVAGGTKGVVKGFGATLRRAGTGAVRLLTFWAG